MSLAGFLDETGCELEDVYRGQGHSWLELQRAAGLVSSSPGPDDAALGSAFGRLLHVDDLERLALFSGLAADPAERRTSVPARLVAMLHFSLWGSRTPFSSVEDDACAGCWTIPVAVTELRELSSVLRDRIHRVTPAVETASCSPAAPARALQPR